ncbi:hypothetical protein [Pseudomonas cremoricolorata]|uniref:HK97 gp10 family phage protein n=1 Tax=Pseudomonas cremoricolorata TaxID=157783 RepID=A0A089WVH5_9PSED|nr:hypothetical protein [Pseudomonas cremoricolorata]AIR90582.1 hypothetical protein LK03_15415 [Pseudomonas cremoricolorata]
MSTEASIQPYMHIEGFDNLPKDFFDKRKVRAGMRKVGKLITQRAQLALALARGQHNYPVSRTGATLESISFKVSRSGFLVRVAPKKTDRMSEYYPAYLHYGVKAGRRVRARAPGGRRFRRGQRARLVAARAAGEWRIKPRANYMAETLDDSKEDVRRILTAAFASALGG